MKHVLRFCALFVCTLVSLSCNAQPMQQRLSTGYALPQAKKTTPSRFSLPSLRTPQAISNAIDRLVSAFKFLSPTTLARIIRTQKEKFEANQAAFAENPTWANRGAMVANVLAMAAATIVLGGEAAALGAAGYAGGKAIQRQRAGARKRAAEAETVIAVEAPEAFGSTAEGVEWEYGEL